MAYTEAIGYLTAVARGIFYSRTTNKGALVKCPVDNATLVMSDKQNIEIDYCPDCRGVWLDRGELDKIIERSAASQAPIVSYDEPRHEDRRDSYRDTRNNDHGYDHSYHKKKRKENFLGELFDF